MKAGVERAREVVASGAAKKKLDEFVAFTQGLAGEKRA
jgi:anthranilate phosphoribosyltransferase